METSFKFMNENIIAVTNLFNEAEAVSDLVQCLLVKSLLFGPVEVVELV